MSGRRLGSVLALTVLGVSALAACAGDPGSQSAPTTDPVTQALLAAVPDDGSPIPLALSTPRDGAVIPFSFTALSVSWTDGFRGTAALIRVLDDQGAVLLARTTPDRQITLGGKDWAAVKQGVGPGGRVRVQLTVGSWRLDGTPLLRPARVVSEVRLATAEEDPTGRLIYGRKLRPADRGPGPVHVDERTVALTEVATGDWTRSALVERMPGEVVPETTTPAAERAHSVDFSSRTRISGKPGHADPGNRGERACVSCHTVSAQGRFLAVSSQSDGLVPPGYDASQGVLHVIRTADDELLKVIPGAVFPRFHPHKVGRLLYGAAGSSFSVKQRVSIYRSDLEVVDVERREAARPVPGAAHPEHCELFGDWSPSGETIVFARSAFRQPCDGSRGQLDLFTVPWNEGQGGAPQPVEGASGNGLSNAQPRYSPDGKWLVFYAADRGFFSRGTADLYVVPAAGGTARKLSVSTRAMESWHAFSPDGRWLAFVSNRDRIDRPWLYLSRFEADGTTHAALPVPGASGATAHVHTFDWAPP